MFLPNLSHGSQSRDVVDTFAGYNHRQKISPSEWYFTKNLSTKNYPMFSTRTRRGKLQTMKAPQGLIAKDKLAYVDNGTLYYDGSATPITGLSAGKKQIVGMGAYICIWPDKVFYNTENPSDYGNMEDTVTFSGNITYQPCRLSGEEYTGYPSQDTPPEDPKNGDLWYDTAAKSLKEYSDYQEEWVSIAVVYTKISLGTSGFAEKHFKKFDGVTISRSAFPDIIDGDKVIQDIGTAYNEDYIIVIGLIEAPKRVKGTVMISRTVPDLDYVCECQNRIWGCYYGQSENGNLNEIYCCSLGDFRNWHVFQGISTDSWVGSVGSDGPWTGAVNYLGYPTFFKDNRIHRVTVSSVGAHSITETVCRGVQQGSERSLVVVNEVLFYKSRTDVCVYQGGFPEGISQALGEVQYYDAVAGAYGDRYYISMRDQDNAWHHFVFDSENKLWMREDDLHVMQYATLGDSIYAIDEDSSALLDLNGASGDIEPELNWEAVSGIRYYETPDRKYTSRYDLRISAPAGSEVQMFIQYDSDGIWRFCGKHFWRTLATYAFPVRPRRCDHLVMKLVGNGDVKIYNIACILEQGSDM